MSANVFGVSRGALDRTSADGSSASLGSPPPPPRTAIAKILPCIYELAQSTTHHLQILFAARAGKKVRRPWGRWSATASVRRLFENML